MSISLLITTRKSHVARHAIDAINAEENIVEVERESEHVFQFIGYNDEDEYPSAEIAGIETEYDIKVEDENESTGLFISDDDFDERFM